MKTCISSLLLLVRIGLWSRGMRFLFLLFFIIIIFFMINASMHIVPGVAGGAASGKTTVCDMIIQQLHDQRVVLVNQVMLPCFR